VYALWKFITKIPSPRRRAMAQHLRTPEAR
jgi:hypothetical protein